MVTGSLLALMSFLFLCGLKIPSIDAVRPEQVESTVRDSNGWTDLTLLVLKGDLDKVKNAIAHGAKMDAVDKRSRTLADLAQLQGCKEMVDYLATQGVPAPVAPFPLVTEVPTTPGYTIPLTPAPNFKIICGDTPAISVSEIRNRQEQEKLEKDTSRTFVPQPVKNYFIVDMGTVLQKDKDDWLKPPSANAGSFLHLKIPGCQDGIKLTAGQLPLERVAVCSTPNETLAFFELHRESNFANQEIGIIRLANKQMKEVQMVNPWPAENYGPAPQETYFSPFSFEANATTATCQLTVACRGSLSILQSKMDRSKIPSQFKDEAYLWYGNIFLERVYDVYPDRLQLAEERYVAGSESNGLVLTVVNWVCTLKVPIEYLWDLNPELRGKPFNTTDHTLVLYRASAVYPKN